MEILKISDLHKSFGKVKALDGVSLSLKKGEVYGFIGPNGAGKTTTIRVLLGILKADSGDCKVFDMDSWQDSVEIHKKVAYVPGEVNLWPNLTGGEVIDLFTSLRGKLDLEKRDSLIKRFNLDPTKKCRTYSKGNRQKVALIAAFASDAELFILDEPTSGLDPLMEREFHKCVEEVKKEGKTVFLSSHILVEVEKLCDKVAIIKDGKIIESGSLKDMKHLTRTNIYAETKKEIKGIDKLKGVYSSEKKEYGYSFQVDNEHLPEIIKKISEYEIIKIESYPPSLEELFMRHYEQTEVE